MARAEKGYAPERDGSGVRERYFAQWLSLPLQPGPVRATRRRELVKGQVWALEQCFGVLDVVVNVRMTLVKLSDGTLLAYAPVAPTRECRRLVDQLGPVSHIVLPTTAVEHKVLLLSLSLSLLGGWSTDLTGACGAWLKVCFGPFARAYPGAECWAVPKQWSWPVKLPLSLLGLFPRRPKLLRKAEAEPPWAREVEVEVLETTLGLGPFVEAACFHKKTRTLLVTDAVIEVPKDPPDVCTIDTRALMNRAKEDKDDRVEDTAEGRRRGWLKTALFALYFQPGKVDFSPLDGFSWRPGWRRNADRITDKLLVPPILQTLVFNKRPSVVADWVERICSWPFTRIVPCHFSAPISARPRDFRAAFSFLPGLRSGPAGALSRLFGPADRSDFPEDDIMTLRGINRLVVATRIVTPDDDSPPP